MLETFLRLFPSRWVEFWDDTRLRFAPAAEPTLPLARFIYEAKKIKWIEENGERKAVAKWKAFEPPKSLKLSVMHTEGVARNSVWDIDPLRGSKLAIAAAHFHASDAISQGLDVLRDNRPPRHVTIRGWPSERYDRMAVIEHLAAVSEVQVRSGG